MFLMGRTEGRKEGKAGDDSTCKCKDPLLPSVHITILRGLRVGNHMEFLLNYFPLRLAIPVRDT